MGNKEVKQRLKELYGARCFLTNLKTIMTYHHVFPKRLGGPNTVENGALLDRIAHDYLHHLECTNKELYHLLNECLQLYKKCLEENKTDCLEIWDDVQGIARREIKVKRKRKKRC